MKFEGFDNTEHNTAAAQLNYTLEYAGNLKANVLEQYGRSSGTYKKAKVAEARLIVLRHALNKRYMEERKALLKSIPENMHSGFPADIYFKKIDNVVPIDIGAGNAT